MIFLLSKINFLELIYIKIIIPIVLKKKIIFFFFFLKFKNKILFLLFKEMFGWGGSGGH
jgi:hypothetical protein